MIPENIKQQTIYHKYTTPICNLIAKYKCPLNVNLQQTNMVYKATVRNTKTRQCEYMQ